MFKRFNFKKLKTPSRPLILLTILFGLWFSKREIILETLKQRVGLVTDEISVSGTGSMYPTFPKGEGDDPKKLAKEMVANIGMLPYPQGVVLWGKRYFGSEIGRGDIVSFQNQVTDELTLKSFSEATGLLKRVIAIGGDTLEIKDGLVILNGEPIKEQYTAKPHSTFGEASIHDCQKITIPEGFVFVMGDNRKGSADSREFGVINKSFIDHILPFSKQIGTLDKNWRDTKDDLNASSKIKIDKEKYLKLLNEKRVAAKIKPLKYQTKLENSARKRGAVILKYDDFSFEATRSGYTMQKATKEAGYSNIVYGEAPSLGFYDAEELIENQFAFPKSSEFLLGSDYQDIGIAEVEGQINGCPAQVVVLHLGGYIPPNYKAEEIDSWKKALDSLNSVIQSWEQGLGVNGIHQEDLKKLLDILNQEKQIATNVLGKMESNKWLTQSDLDSIDKYNSLIKESIELANKLNGR